MHEIVKPVQKSRLLNKKAFPFASAALVFYIIVIAVILILRQFFGVNFFDEPIYTFFPYHLVMGGKAFVDEFMLQQGSGILLFPIYWLYVHFFGSTAIIFFGRLLFLSFSFSTFLMLNYLLKPWVEQPFRALIALNVFIFAFLNLYASSYDSLCLLLLCISFFLLAQPEGCAFFSGVFLGLAIFVYPPMLLLLPVMLIVSSDARLNFIAGLATLFLPFFIFILASGRLPNLVADFHLVTSLSIREGGNPLKLYDALLSIIANSLFLYPVFLILPLCFCLDKKHHPTVMLSFIFLFSLLLILTPQIVLECKSAFFVIALTILGALCPEPKAENKKLFHCVFLPSIFAGLITAWSSNNGWMNLALGFFPAFLASLIFGVKWIFCCSNPNLRTGRGLLSLFCVNFFFIGSAWLYVYWDAPINALTARIHNGPFQFLYTTPGNAHLIDSWQKDLAPYAHQRYSLFEYYNTPAIFLIDELTPDTPSAVILDPNEGYPQQNSLQYFAKHQDPDLIVRMNLRWVTLRTPPAVPTLLPSLLDAFLKTQYHPIRIRPSYTLYQENHV